MRRCHTKRISETFFGWNESNEKEEENGKNKFEFFETKFEFEINQIQRKNKIYVESLNFWQFESFIRNPFKPGEDKSFVAAAFVWLDDIVARRRSIEILEILFSTRPLCIDIFSQ